MSATHKKNVTHKYQQASLSVCIVTYRPLWSVLEATLQSLKVALDRLEAIDTEVVIVDNSPADEVTAWMASTMPEFAVTIISGHGNIGFGRANNLALEGCKQFHLVLNPDVEMEPEALCLALRHMVSYPDCGLLCPSAFSPDGRRQYLCKRYPTIFDLFLRGFAPRPLRRLFRRRLYHYEMRDQIGDQVLWDPPIISGCFMFFRGSILRSLNGFDPRFMLYFEDFDISIRASAVTRVAYVPDVRIVHGGGNAARKGLWHISQFLRSAFVFYSSHVVKFF